MLKTRGTAEKKKLITLIVIAEDGTHVDDAIRMLKPVVAVHNVKDVAITVQLSDVVDKGGFELVEPEATEEGPSAQH